MLHSRAGRLEPRVDRLALQGEDAEDALVDPVERLGPGEALQRLDAEGELAQGEASACGRGCGRAGASSWHGLEVLGAVDDPQVLGAAAP